MFTSAILAVALLAQAPAPALFDLDMSGMTKRLDSIDSKLGSIDAKLGSIDDRLDMLTHAKIRRVSNDSVPPPPTPGEVTKPTVAKATKTSSVTTDVPEGWAWYSLTNCPGYEGLGPVVNGAVDVKRYRKTGETDEVEGVPPNIPAVTEVVVQPVAYTQPVTYTQPAATYSNGYTYAAGTCATGNCSAPASAGFFGRLFGR